MRAFLRIHRLGRDRDRRSVARRPRRWQLRPPAWLAGLVVAGCEILFDRESVLVLEDVAAGDGQSRLKRETAAPRRHPVAYAVRGRRYRGDVYLPGSAPLAALVLIPGVAQAGKDDPRLVAFATTLARARFVVLVPDLPGIRALKVRAQDAVGVADAFEHLVSGPAGEASAHAGIGAFSYACGPAILAALEPATSERVDFILAVGGYYDLARVLTFTTTGYFREQGRWTHTTPISYGKWVFVLSNLDLLPEPDSRKALARMAERRMADPGAPLDDLVSQLGAEGRAVHALVTNTDPQRVSALIRALPEAVRQELDALTLAGRDLSALRARLILVHGREDAIIPYTESVALAAAAPQSELYLVDGLSHVDVRPDALDRLTLVRAVHALLAQRTPAWSRSRAPSADR
jgi:pimeloyl-ACP methyl ester carboxylesterase